MQPKISGKHAHTQKIHITASEGTAHCAVPSRGACHARSQMQVQPQARRRHGFKHHTWARSGTGRHGAAPQGRNPARPQAWRGRHGTAWVALARHITERRDLKRRGPARAGAARTERGGTAWARHDISAAQPDQARRGPARLGAARRHGSARDGAQAEHGLARLSTAQHCKALQSTAQHRPALSRLSNGRAARPRSPGRAAPAAP